MILSTMRTVFNLIYPRLSFLTRPLYGGAGLILMFHRVCPASKTARIQANAGMEITPEHLEAIIQFFTERHYEFISMDQMVEYLHTDRWPQKFVVVTFDDGYVDNITHAYPIFKKHRIPFTLYVTTGFPDAHAILWWYLLEDLLLRQEFLMINDGFTQKEFFCPTMAQKEAAFYCIRTMIMNAPTIEAYMMTVAALFSVYGMDLFKKTKKLAAKWKQIEEISRDPLVTIGAHTVNHFSLSKLSPTLARNEIIKSQQIIQSHIQKEVYHFAYPFGGKEEAGPREFALVKECGFKTAVTTRFAAIFKEHKDHLESLPRFFIHPGADESFLNTLLDGTAAGFANKFKRIVT